MPSKTKPLGPTELSAYEAKRNLAAELLEAVRQMKSGQVGVVTTPANEAGLKTGLSQSEFAKLLGVSVRTLQGWEQGRKQPSGAARTLLAIARANPKTILEVRSEAIKPRNRRELVLEAIESKKLLSFTYNGKRREVEPQCLGLGKRGNQLLRAHQLQGGSEPEPLFDVARMSALVVLDRHFDRPGPHYKRGDSAMTKILAQL